MQNEQRLKSLSKTEQMLHNLFLGSSQSKFSDSDVQIQVVYDNNNDLELPNYS